MTASTIRWVALLSPAVWSASPALSGPAADAGLVAHYMLDDGSGAVAADTGSKKHDATIKEAIWVKTDGAAVLQFDGRTALVECGLGRRLGLKDKLTVAAWVLPKGKPTKEPLIVGEGTAQWGLTHYKGRVYFYISSGGNYCYAPVSYHQWSHVAGTFDGTTLKLYVNGDLRASKVLPAATKIKSGGKVVIGANPKTRSFFNGVIGDVRIYDRVLSPKELAKLVRRPGWNPEALRLDATQRSAATRFFKTHGKPLASGGNHRQLWLANRHVGIEFVRGQGSAGFSRLYGVAAAQDLAVASAQGLWQLVMRKDQGKDAAEVTVTSRQKARVSSDFDQAGSTATLRLRWQGLPVADEADVIDVEVRVTLREGDPLSRWRINVTNRSKIYGLWSVVFPLFEVRAIGPEPRTNAWAMGRARGTVTKDPFSSPPSRSFGIGTNFGCNWPGTFDMQFQALYDQSGTGLYLATHDGGGYKKTFYFTPYKDKGVIEYKVRHYPANMGYPAEDYRMAYDACIGPFRGDWYDACQIYRRWAIQQRWCANGPLATRKDIPEWYKIAPIMFSTMSKEGNRQVIESRDRMIDFLHFIGMELPVAWYTWKKHFPDKTDYNKPGSPWKVPDARPYPCGNIHDGNYPIMPALSEFGPACRAISEAGGHVKAYVCAQIYDPGLNENAPLAAQAKPNVVRDVQGRIKLAERNMVAWLMCYHTKWWQDRMAETVTELIKREHVGGIYFDTFYGGYVQCFETGHGHSHGGGNDPYLGARRISAVVRGAMKKADPRSVMSGESPAETAIDLLDGFLYRTTVWPDMAPLFATVYGDYICRHGISLDPQSPGFYIQCATLFTEGAKMGRLRINAADHYLKDFGTGSKYTDRMTFLRRLSRFWKPGVGARYLAYGRLLRPLRFIEPDPMPTASYTESRYKYYKEGLITVSALQAGVFAASDGSLGIFVVNVTDKPITCRFELTPGEYPLQESKTYQVTRISESGDRGHATVVQGKIVWAGKVGGRDVLFLEAK